MMKKKITYTEAFERLQTIVAQVESGEITVDHLADSIAEAKKMAEICKQALYSTEEAVSHLLSPPNHEKDS